MPKNARHFKVVKISFAEQKETGGSAGGEPLNFSVWPINHCKQRAIRQTARTRRSFGIGIAKPACNAN
jgi:hypothetical protein